jgi:hypothetical protein
LDVYKKYKNTPQMAEHQIAVAAVAELLVSNILNPSSLILNRGDIVAACLLHDIGNIVKFNFDQTKEIYPELFIKPEDREYWENVKKEFTEKYGKSSHEATAKIIKEIGVSNRVFELVDSVGFSQGVDNAWIKDFGKKICAYSDMRVMPGGVSSLEERMADLRVRYKNHPEGETDRDKFELALRKIEQQIFEHCRIKPEDITEQAVKDRKEALKNFEI